MKAYLVCVVLICAMVSLASHFLSGMDAARYGRLGLSVVLLWAVIAPLSSLLSSLPAWPQLPEPPAAGEESPLYEARAEAAFCEGIAAAVCEKFSLKEEEISVRAEDFNLTAMKAQRIYIILKGQSVFADSFAIATFVESEGLGDCEVGIEFGGS